MKRHTVATMAVATATLAVALAGCTGVGGTTGGGDKSPASGSLKIAVSYPNSAIGDPFWISMECGVKDAAAKLGATVTFKDSPDSDTGHIAQALDATSLTNPDGLITSGSSSSANNAKIQSIQSSGVPVVVNNAPNEPEVAWIDIISSSDNSEFATYVAGDIGADSGTIGVLGGIAGFPVLDARWQPMAAALKTAAPGITVLPPQYDNFEVNKAASAASALIVAHPDLRAIYAVSGPEGQGAASAVQQAGKTGQVKVYTYDATPEVVAGIKSGAISAALAQSPYTQGSAAVEALVSRLKDATSGPVTRDASKDQALPLKILNKSNIDDPSTAAYQYKPTCG